MKVLPRIQHVADLHCPCHPLGYTPMGGFQQRWDRDELAHIVLPIHPQAIGVLNHQDEIGEYLRCLPGVVLWHREGHTPPGQMLPPERWN